MSISEPGRPKTGELRSPTPVRPGRPDNRQDPPIELAGCRLPGPGYLEAGQGRHPGHVERLDRSRQRDTDHHVAALAGEPAEAAVLPLRAPGRWAPTPTADPTTTPVRRRRAQRSTRPRRPTRPGRPECPPPWHTARYSAAPAAAFSAAGRQTGGAVPADHQAGRAGADGGADHGPQVVRVGDAVENHEERHRRRPARSRGGRSSASSGKGSARASTPWGASDVAMASSWGRETHRRRHPAGAGPIQDLGQRTSSVVPSATTSWWVRRRPARNSSRTAWRPSTCSPPRPDEREAEDDEDADDARREAVDLPCALGAPRQIPPDRCGAPLEEPGPEGRRRPPRPEGAGLTGAPGGPRPDRRCPPAGPAPRGPRLAWPSRSPERRRRRSAGAPWPCGTGASFGASSHRRSTSTLPISHRSVDQEHHPDEQLHAVGVRRRPDRRPGNWVPMSPSPAAPSRASAIRRGRRRRRHCARIKPGPVRPAPRRAPAVVRRRRPNGWMSKPNPTRGVIAARPRPARPPRPGRAGTSP